MTKNAHQNRLELLQAQRNDGSLGVELRSLCSANRNLFTEQTCAPPDYTRTRALAGSPVAADPDPNATPPEAVWDLMGYRGAHGYVSFIGGTTPSCDLELWAYDELHDNWFLVASISGISEKEEFHFNDSVRNRTVFVRVSAVSGSPTQLGLFVSPE